MSKTKKSKTTLRRLVLVIAAILLGLNIYKWNARSLMGNQLPMPFGIGVSVVLTGSMEPTLSANDLVFVKESDTVAVGDIVVYQSGNSLVIHRVMEVGEDFIVTKGDANNAADEPIALTDVKGVMTAAIPAVGAVVRLAKRPVVVIAVLIAAVVLTELSYRKDKKENEKELGELEDEIRKLMAEIKDDLK